MKNDQTPATAHHAITTARRPDNIRSSILVQGRSIRSMAHSGCQPRRPCPERIHIFAILAGFLCVLMKSGDFFSRFHHNRYCPCKQPNYESRVHFMRHCALSHLRRPDNGDAPPKSLVEREKMPHEMHARIIVGLSARAISVMMKSGDVHLRESNPGFRGRN